MGLPISVGVNFYKNYTDFFLLMVFIFLGDQGACLVY